MRTAWNFHTVGQLVFGAGATEQIGDILARRSLRRVMMITDPNLVAVGHADRVRQSLERAGITVGIWDAGEPEPPIEVACRAAEQAGAFGPDAILGLGGGSNMDVAKSVAVLLTHGGKLPEYLGIGKVPGPLMPLICVPTTAGTGSEVSHCMVLTDTTHAIKVSSLSHYLRPMLAVVDPELTQTCPRRVTADSGVDALVHAIEAYTATKFSQLDQPANKPIPYEGAMPLSDLLAKQAIELIGQHFLNTLDACDTHDANPTAAREGMALAATLAGMAFSNAGVALTHAMEYPLGGKLHCSHGSGNGLLLPHVMRFNLPARTHRIAEIADLLQVETTNQTQQQAAESAIVAIEQLLQKADLPRTLRDLGSKESDLATFAEKAFAIQGLIRMNPQPPTQEDILAIYRAAF